MTMDRSAAFIRSKFDAPLGISSNLYHGQADRARTDFAAIESDLEVIQEQLSRLPTRRELAGTVLAIIFATMMLATLSLLFFTALLGKI